MIASARKTRHYASLRCTTVPSRNGVDSITLHTSDKREMARQLIAAFESGAKRPENFNFRGLSLKGADLRGLNLRALGGAALRQIDFTGANLSGQNFSRLNLRQICLEGATLTGATFAYSILENANLRNAKLGSVNFYRADARGADLNHAAAPGANWEGNFRGARLAVCRMAFGYIGEGTSFENARMRQADLTGTKVTQGEACFRGAEMQEAILRGDFRHANFAGADLTEARMEGGRFDHVTAPQAITTGARTDSFTRFSRYASLRIEEPTPTAPTPRRRHLFPQLAAA